MKIRTIIGAALAVVMLSALAACNDNANTDKGSAPDEASSVISESPSASVNSPSSDASTAKPAQDNSSEAASGSKPAASSTDNESTSSAKEDWKTAFEKSLMEQYGLKPHHYVDLGDGIYEVYVEREGKIISFVTVDSATGDYHG